MGRNKIFESDSHAPLSGVSSRLVLGPHIQNELLCGFCNGHGCEHDLEVCKPCRGTGLDTQKFLRVADLRDVEGQHNQEKISYSRMVEILNEKATKFMYEWIKERIVAREEARAKANVS